MNANRWQAIERLYHEALARPAGERAAFLASACGGDASMRQEIESLLAQPATGAGALDHGVFAAAGDLVDESGQSMIGRRLGVYDITAVIGAGGMGEVYRAHDRRLGRDVAIKILPSVFTSDPDRVARFEREARVLASLNHPNIATIHGVEDGAIVMELVEGQSLAEYIASGVGRTRVRDALAIARQIADALEAAHEKGIVHRDLKPANVRLTRNGTVKVLDFGLAKAIAVDDAGEGEASGELTVAATRQGVIVGTAAYMSPEQARGQAVDTRTDVWAFGCVLYELLCGRRAFAGDDVAVTLSKVLQLEPDFTALPAGVPPVLRRFVERCLHKDPRQRVHHVADLRLAVEGAFEVPVAQVADAKAGRSRPVWPLGLTAFGGAVAGAVLLWSVSPATTVTTERLAIIPPDTAALSIDGSERDISVTPDGLRVVYVGNNGTQVFIRPLDRLEPIPLVTTPRTVRGVFTSPDGNWVGFVEGTNALRKVAMTGGPPLTLASIDGNPQGATWGSDGAIVFATANPVTGLQRVSADGGRPEVLTAADTSKGEADHVWPEMLPDGRGVLFTVTAVNGGLENAQVAAFDPSTRTVKTLLRGGHHAHYVSGGFLVYATGSVLRAAAFDLDRMEMRSSPVAVVPGVVTTTNGGADFVVATNGTLAYVNAAEGAIDLSPVWVDRSGRETPVGAPRRSYQYPRMIPGGNAIAFNDSGSTSMWDVRRATFRRLVGDVGVPVWTADGSRMVFSSTENGGGRNLYLQAADVSGQAERLTESPNAQVPSSITPDGRSVVFHEITRTAARDVRIVTLPTSGRPAQTRDLIATRFDERNGLVSPDGRWLSYESDKAGQLDVYVRPFPNIEDGEWMVSTAGGRQAAWAPDGTELFYVALDGSLFTVPVEARGAVWNTGAPAKLFDNRYFSSGGVPRQYDISPDGERLVLLKRGGEGGATPQIVVVLNWVDELRRLVTQAP